MKADLRRILSETACLDVPIETLGDSDDLYAAGLSSLGSVRVMMAIEDVFGIEIPDELITYDLFRSIDSLENTIGQVRAGGDRDQEETTRQCADKP
ncbi:Aminoacyl carrier protein [Paraburkholderia domus]|jgi:Acyl carrier protein|uniref:acyl carrier protein n=1 Tax=Paraburkholderia domus TaxID=2793075 RepID=UPI001913E65F|nr:acyl carrier protein [Paraburkholderia domus]MBK5052515.1 acyl carrier protein [Burkholderia sp. R-70006]MBK5089025.1 acyl carrier protein [Burkholderia sp. R-69927]MBK5184298.1 acyl carrier protein [Burkholderia sp. R-69749]MCI0145655.1 acyl carrier protein [Paraburkholderia sediminicola]CAE6725948.1 Aminoacyl carrier protein [Paraburkholderia domus]